MGYKCPMICQNCNKRQREKDGAKFKPTCYRCRKGDDYVKQRDKRKYISKYRSHLQHRKNKCEKCNFVPVHVCQLDVDHIDGNHNNNDPVNLQTLCANCHRLKTYLAENWG